MSIKINKPVVNNKPISNSSDNSPGYKPPYYSLTLVTNKQNSPLHDYLKFIHSCAKAGVTAVQLREKNMSYAALIEFGEEIQKILIPLNIPLIINDNVELAIALNAAGVHLGQTDHCPQKARTQLGSEKIIGVSIDSLANLHEANQLPINYVGIGSIFPTQNKANVATIWGTAGLKQAAALSTHPVVAIGGINERNAPDVISAGANGIAAIGAFHNAIDLSTTIKTLLQIINDTKRPQL